MVKYMHKILIIEDDMTIAKTLTKHLESWQYLVEYCKDFNKVIEEFIAYDPQLVLLDISLPIYNGYHWCKEIRKFSTVPIVFISSMNDNMNIVMAMNMGADDFITKPFDLYVLTAKVEAILRRSYSFSGTSNIISYQDVILNIGDTTVFYHDKQIELTKNELKILQILLETPGNIVSREDIMIKLWQSNQFVDDNTLTVNVTRLRKHLEEINLYDFIITKKGIGYMVR